MSVYSFGIDSPLKFNISDEFAKMYNAAVDDFMQAQLKFRESNGRDWTPDDALFLQHSTPEAFAIFATILEDAQNVYGKPVYEEDIKDDHLIKN